MSKILNHQKALMANKMVKYITNSSCLAMSISLLIFIIFLLYCCNPVQFDIIFLCFFYVRNVDYIGDRSFVYYHCINIIFKTWFCSLCDLLCLFYSIPSQIEFCGVLMLPLKHHQFLVTEIW